MTKRERVLRIEKEKKMKLYEAMKLLDEYPTDVYEAKLNDVWKYRMRVKQGVLRGYYYFEVFKSKRLVDKSCSSGAFNGNVALDLDWQLVKKPVTWQEAIEAWADGKTISYSYKDGDIRFPFEDSNTMLSVEKIKIAKWYVED